MNLTFADRFLLFICGVVCCLGSTLVASVGAPYVPALGPIGPFLVGGGAIAFAAVSTGLLADAMEGHQPRQHLTVWVLLLAACALLVWQAYRSSAWEIFLPLATLAACPPLVLLRLLEGQQRHQASA